MANPANCHLDIVDVTTDNHLVLVNPKVVTDNPLREQATKKQITAVFHTREAKSVTAEFTPRVRADGRRTTRRDFGRLLGDSGYAFYSRYGVDVISLPPL